MPTGVGQEMLKRRQEEIGKESDCFNGRSPDRAELHKCDLAAVRRDRLLSKWPR
jgi:hypothetical protein